MNTIADSKLFFLKDDCVQIFGKEKGLDIYICTKQIYKDLCENADYKGDEAIKFHLTMNLYPTMSYYKSLQKFGYSKQEALEFTRKETARAAEIKKIEQAKLCRIPFTYYIYKLFFKGVMKKNFPDTGWQTEWVCFNNRQIHFNLHRCIYKDLCDSEGCPELCVVFCENDDIAFSGLLPKIQFKRSGTLGKGNDCCDFHFINNKLL